MFVPPCAFPSIPEGHITTLHQPMVPLGKILLSSKQSFQESKIKSKKLTMLDLMLESH